MIVRIRFGAGPRVVRKGRKNRRLALAFAAILTPAAVMAAALAVWGLAAGPSWASKFAISSGLLSHWQVWMALAIVLQTGSHALNRYGHGGQVMASAPAASSPLVRS